MKKNVIMMKRLEQYLVKEDSPIELEQLHLILIKNIKKNKEKAKRIAEKQDELYECLNPRYFEHGIRPREALIKLDALFLRNNQSLIRNY